jgi:hypothetical protein
MTLDTGHWLSEGQLEFLDKLARLGLYANEPADDEFRELIEDVREEFEKIRSRAVRDGLRKPGPLNAEDVLLFGAAAGNDFPDAKKGCEVFASVAIVETGRG